MLLTHVLKMLYRWKRNTLERYTGRCGLTHRALSYGEISLKQQTMPTKIYFSKLIQSNTEYKLQIRDHNMYPIGKRKARLCIYRDGMFMFVWRGCVSVWRVVYVYRMLVCVCVCVCVWRACFGFNITRDKEI